MNELLLDFRKERTLSKKYEERRMWRENIPLKSKNCFNIGIFWSNSAIGTRQTDRLKALLPYFSEERLTKIVVPIISVNARISLRALDWFVINFAKKHKITLITINGKIFNVYNNYRSWLRYWKRDLFDAFRRGPRIYFEFKDYSYSTTPAQLNFLYWCETTAALSYADRHLSEIELDMTQRINECKYEKVKSDGKRKRSELSHAPIIKCMVYNVPVKIEFTK